MFGMVIERVFLSDMAKVSNERDKKYVTVGVARVLCECTSMTAQPYRGMWPLLLQSLIQMVELPPDEQLLDADFVLADEGEDGYQAAFSQLAYAQPNQADVMGVDISDPIKSLVGGLGIREGSSGRSGAAGRCHVRRPSEGSAGLRIQVRHAIVVIEVLAVRRNIAFQIIR